MANLNEERKCSFGAAVLFGLIACVLYGVGAGLRGDIGILVNPLAEYCGLSYADVSMCIAVMQLVFGASQPFFGLIAAKRSNRAVLVAGVIFLCISMMGMVWADSYLGLFLALGIAFGLGTGAIAFGLVLASAIRFVGQANAMLISGMLNAAAGMMGFIFSPLLQSLLDWQGLSFTLYSLAGIIVLLLPIIAVVTSRDNAAENLSSEVQDINAASLFREAFANKTFRMLFAGFTTCGFHMVIIESHLFSQFVLFGIDEVSASWVYSVYGIATIVGALLSGFLSIRLRKGRLLAFYYGFRAVWVLAYIWLLPKTMVTAVLFAVGLGMTGDATVSPTSGLVSENFAVGKVATLLGVLFLTHQVGAFFSAWLGGLLRELLGGYAAIWLMDIGLCLFAGVMSFRIEDGRR
jgi:predicted MFS family arabinose efflux permease